jgi:hypothetical protein
MGWIKASGDLQDYAIVFANLTSYFIDVSLSCLLLDCGSDFSLLLTAFARLPEEVVISTASSIKVAGEPSFSLGNSSAVHHLSDLEL